MITFSVPPGLFPGLAYDGTLTFSGILQSYFTIADATGQNIGISRGCNDNTAAQYRRDYQKRVLPLLSQLFGDEKPMHEFSAEDFELFLTELRRKHHYAEETIKHYRYLLRVAYYSGVDNNLYPDQIFWEEIYDNLNNPEEYEIHRAAAMTRIRKSFSIHEDIQLMLYFSSLEPATASGEEIGLMLMYFLGLRNNEACGADFSALRTLGAHTDRAVFDMVQTTVIGNNQLKMGGKTGNAPRTLPMHKWVYTFLQSRRTWIEEQITSGALILPENIYSVDQLPIVCKGVNYTIRCHTTDLSRAGRALFERVGIKKSELAVLQEILFSEDFRATQIEEKDPTTYLLRRNVATRMYHLGFEWTTIQYWIAHEIEDSLLQRNFFSDEETLYELGLAYENHPIFSILEANIGKKLLLEPEIYCSKHFSFSSESDAFYRIEATALEPGTSISVAIRSNKPFSILQTEIPSHTPYRDVIEISAALYRAYWKAYNSIAINSNINL